MFLEKPPDSLEVYNVSLLGYVCMTNHYHLLVTTPEGNLSSFMRHFNDGYLKEVSWYVHLNPVRMEGGQIYD